MGSWWCGSYVEGAVWEVGGVGVMLKELCGKLVEVIAVSNRVMLKELCGKLVVWELC